METTIINNTNNSFAKLSNTIYIFRDVSASITQYHELIGTSIKNYLNQIKKVNDQDTEVETRIILINFSTNLEYVNTQPLLPQELLEIYDPTPKLGSSTVLSKVYREMDKLLSRNNIINPVVNSSLPIFIFITDHEACGDNEYQQAYQHLAQNNWFKKILKIAIGINNGVDTLVEFTKNQDLTITLDDSIDITTKLSLLLVTATAIASKTHIEDKENCLIDEIDHIKNYSSESIIDQVINILNED